MSHSFSLLARIVASSAVVAACGICSAEEPKFESQIRPIVREYCLSIGVPYTETSLMRSYAIVIEYLNRVGLSARDSFDCPMVDTYRR